MRNQQRGMTMIGWVAVLAIVGIFALAAMRIVPVYMEYFKIANVLADLSEEMRGQKPNQKAIQEYVRKRFDIESINAIDHHQIEISRLSDSYEVKAEYDDRVPFVSNIDFCMTFSKSVEIAR